MKSCKHFCRRSLKTEQLHGGGVRVKANLLGTHLLTAHLYSQCITRKCLTLQIKVKIMEYRIRNVCIRWQISNSVKVILWHFC